MINSMTGFGKSDVSSQDYHLTVELRALNSRYLDYSSKLPRPLTMFDDVAYRLLKENCARGRITLTATLSVQGANNGRPELNRDMVDQYLGMARAVQEITGAQDQMTIGDFLNLPDVIQPSTEQNEELLQDLFLKGLKEAIAVLNKMRRQEGLAISADFEDRLQHIADRIEQITALSENNRQSDLEKYRNKIEELANVVSLDENRLIQEIAILAEKRDVTEELTRLSSHITLFRDYLNDNTNPGKKLNFLLQEMGREVNTIGSKTELIQISHMIVDIKDELEKMREQVQNIL